MARFNGERLSGMCLIFEGLEGLGRKVVEVVVESLVNQFDDYLIIRDNSYFYLFYQISLLIVINNL